MFKLTVFSAFLALILIVIYMASQMKEAYKVLPGSTSDKLVVAPFSYWREFTPLTHKFKVLFPTVPQYAKDSVDIPNTHQKRIYEMYVSEQLNGNIYMVSVITYPADYNTTNSLDILNEAVNELMVSNPKNRLIKSESKDFDHNRGLSFHIENEEFNIEGQTFLVNKTLFIMTYIAKKADFDLKEYHHFSDSFSLLPPTP